MDPEPLAAASLAQMHRARRTDGTEVILKVKRPGAEAQVESAVDIIRRLAATAEARSSAAKDLNLSSRRTSVHRHPA